MSVHTTADPITGDTDVSSHNDKAVTSRRPCQWCNVRSCCLVGRVPKFTRSSAKRPAYIMLKALSLWRNSFHIFSGLSAPSPTHHFPDVLFRGTNIALCCLQKMWLMLHSYIYIYDCSITKKNDKPLQRRRALHVNLVSLLPPWLPSSPISFPVMLYFIKQNIITRQ